MVREDLIETNKSQLQKIRYLQMQTDKYKLQREQIEKERLVDECFMSTFEKERIDSNNKLSSGKRLTSQSFNKLNEINSKPFSREFRGSDKGSYSKPDFKAWNKPNQFGSNKPHRDEKSTSIKFKNQRNFNMRESNESDGKSGSWKSFKPGFNAQKEMSVTEKRQLANSKKFRSSPVRDVTDEFEARSSKFQKLDGSNNFQGKQSGQRSIPKKPVFDYTENSFESNHRSPTSSPSTNRPVTDSSKRQDATKKKRSYAIE